MIQRLLTRIVSWDTKSPSTESGQMPKDEIFLCERLLWLGLGPTEAALRAAYGFVKARTDPYAQSDWIVYASVHHLIALMELLHAGTVRRCETKLEAEAASLSKEQFQHAHSRLEVWLSSCLEAARSANGDRSAEPIAFSAIAGTSDGNSHETSRLSASKMSSARHAKQQPSINIEVNTSCQIEPRHCWQRPVSQFRDRSPKFKIGKRPHRSVGLVGSLAFSDKEKKSVVARRAA